ncbi:MAG TPA: DinB family protein [Chitinophagaceae bacterium]|nr:DinB family protein [Chitinophagaceae bacterium]
MTFIEFFKKQFIEEGAITRNMLARIPDNQWQYKPHEKSMDMKRLAMHIADLPGWIHMTFTTDEIDFAKPYEQPEINSKEDLVAYFEKRYAAGLETLVPENEALLDKPWTLRNGAVIYSTDPKIAIIRMALSQQIHHRAQLGVYLRLLQIPIPGSYGPSADEGAFEES